MFGGFLRFLSSIRYWLCAATQQCIKIWDLESKSIVDELRPDFQFVSKKAQVTNLSEVCLSNPIALSCASSPKYVPSTLKYVFTELLTAVYVDELLPALNLTELQLLRQVPYCISLNWSADGSTLYSGYTDGHIRVWAVGRA